MSIFYSEPDYAAYSYLIIFCSVMKISFIECSSCLNIPNLKLNVLHYYDIQIRKKNVEDKFLVNIITRENSEIVSAYY